MPQPVTRRGRLLAPLLFALAILLALLYVVAGLPLRRAREAWDRGAYADAIQSVENWSRLRLRPADYSNLLAVFYLSLGRVEDARPHLERLARRKADWFPIIRKEDVGRKMIAAGRYHEFLHYDAAYRYVGESAEARLYRAAAQLGAGRIAEAQTTFASIDAAEVDAKKLAALRTALDERKKGAFPLVMDRNGGTIAVYQVANRDLVAVNQDFAPLVEKDAGTFTIESNLQKLGTSNTLQTTLDPLVQKAAVAALGGFRGALVAIDVRTNELLAIASTPGPGPLQNVAIEANFEPGSVVKVLTALNAIDHRLDLTKLFPVECAGFLILNGRQFFDWAKHGTVSTLEEAMAISCNVAFGKMGLQLGGDQLQKFMQAAGFDTVADLEIFRAPLGKTDQNLPNEYAVASYAVGLEHERINALHMAILAAMVANQGRLAIPRLIRGRESILGEPVGEPAPLRAIPVASPESTQKILPALRAVVDAPRGTGRRAAVLGIPIAMKTGTAGEGEGGYDALIVAFAPADAPRIAIGMIAQDAGPAEFAGAKIVRDFFMQVRDRLQ